MIKDQRDFFAGIMFMAFGAFFCFYSIAKYALGTASRMGPGYFPMLLGGFLLVLGFLITLKSLVFRPSEGDGKVGAIDWRTVIIILGSVFIFAILLRPAGLIPATFIMIFLSGFAERTFKLIPILILATFLSVLVWIIFVWGLDLTVPIWPSF
ncbi:MAG: tripartite tricarboxylate transporter TctB family protein [Burkholderiales bacterium]|nr:tripartite tricarboxylate transporter TctB family protein [Burkholderiales bacterium]